MCRRGDQSRAGENELATERGDDGACVATVTDEIRCMLRAGHDGLHQWRSSDGTRSFEWG